MGLVSGRLKPSRAPTSAVAAAELPARMRANSRPGVIRVAIQRKSEGSGKHTTTARTKFGKAVISHCSSGMTASLRRLAVHGQAARHADRLAGDKGRVIARKEADGARDILGL